jgi:hypothetical protein
MRRRATDAGHWISNQYYRDTPAVVAVIGMVLSSLGITGVDSTVTQWSGERRHLPCHDRCGRMVVVGASQSQQLVVQQKRVRERSQLAETPLRRSFLSLGTFGYPARCRIKGAILPNDYGGFL